MTMSATNKLIFLKILRKGTVAQHDINLITVHYLSGEDTPLTILKVYNKCLHLGIFTQNRTENGNFQNLFTGMIAYNKYIVTFNMNVRCTCEQQKKKR